MAKATFCQEMRAATKGVHDLSDKLVNLKLGLTMSDDGVWAEGLHLFEPIFRFLEAALLRLNHTLMGELCQVPVFDRTDALARDLDHYYGPNRDEWRQKGESVPAVANYLRHLREIESTNPYLLLAYFYHLYMGLLSGGQILVKKRSLAWSSPDSLIGTAGVTQFGPHLIGAVKKQLKETMNRIGQDLDEETRSAVIQEGITVFKLNIDVIKSVTGVQDIFRKRLFYFGAISAAFLALMAFFLLRQ